MALSDAQIGTCLIILGLPLDTSRTYAQGGNDRETMRRAEYVKYALENVNAVQEAVVKDLLDEWAKIEYDTDTIKAEGLDSNPERTRRLIRSRLWTAAGFSPPTSGGIALVRG